MAAIPKPIKGQNSSPTRVGEFMSPSRIQPMTVALPAITPESTGIPRVGIPQVPGLQPIVPQSLIDKSQPMPEDKTPEAFQRMIVQKFPNGVTNDGRKYSDLSSYEITKLLVDKFPDGVTNSGIAYKDYLVKPRNREEAFIASGAMYKVREDEASNPIRNFAGGAKENFQRTVEGAVDVVGNLLVGGEKQINKFTGGKDTEITYDPAQEAIDKGIGSAALETLAGGTSTLTDIVPATAAAKLAFGVMEETPVLEYIPKAIEKGMELASEGLQLTGIEEGDANNIVTTLGNLAFLKGGKKGQQKINDAYSKGGLEAALIATSLQVPQTVIDTALVPLNLTKGAYDGIRGFIRSKKTTQPGTDPNFTYTADNARTSDGVPFTMEQPPGMWSTGKDLVFQRGTNEDLATRSVFPKATKEKGPTAKTEAGKVALAGVEQMYNDNRTGITTSDISTMPGGSEAIEQGLDYYGKQIGDLTSSDSVVTVADAVQTLQRAMEDPKTRYSGPLKSLAEDITSIFSDEAYADGITISDLQDHLSTIKSKIFGDYKNVASLYKESSGRAVKEFLDDISNRFESAIEETTGNLPELQKAKNAYTKYKKIQKDFVASMLVNERNAKGGALSKAGSALGLYELFKNPTLSGIATSIITKTILNEMGMAKSRGGAYESLIRNLDREALARGKSNPPTNDSSNPSPDNSSVAPERPVQPVKTSVPNYNKTNADKLTVALQKGQIDIKKAIEQLKTLSAEEIAKHPELVKLKVISDSITNFPKARFGTKPDIAKIETSLEPITKGIKNDIYTPEELDYIEKNMPPEAQPILAKAFDPNYVEEVEVKGEKKVSTETIPAKNVPGLAEDVRMNEKGEIEPIPIAETPPEVVSTPEPIKDTPEVKETTEVDIKVQNKINREYDSQVNALANRSSMDDMANGNFEKERAAITNRVYGKDKLLEEKQALLNEIKKLKNEETYNTDETAKRMVRAREKSIAIIDNEVTKTPTPKEGAKYEVNGKQFKTKKEAIAYSNELENWNKDNARFSPEKKKDTTIRGVEGFNIDDIPL